MHAIPDPLLRSTSVSDKLPLPLKAVDNSGLLTLDCLLWGLESQPDVLVVPQTSLARDALGLLCDLIARLHAQLLLVRLLSLQGTRRD